MNKDIEILGLLRFGGLDSITHYPREAIDASYKISNKAGKELCEMLKTEPSAPLIMDLRQRFNSDMIRFSGLVSQEEFDLIDKVNDPIMAAKIIIKCSDNFSVDNISQWKKLAGSYHIEVDNNGHFNPEKINLR